MKNKLVSIVITTKNSSQYIEACLKSIKTQIYKNIEIIVIDNNSKDKTKEIAQKYTKFVFNKGPERSAQRNFGGSKSKGEYLLFIDSDMELSKDIVNHCVIKINEQKSETEGMKIKGIIIPEKSFGEGFWAKCKALERSYYLGVDWLEAPRFFSKDVFDEFQGYDLSQTGTEDYDLPQRIKSKYGIKTIGRINSFIYHNEGRLSLFYTLNKKFYYAKTINVYAERKINKGYFNKQGNILERYKLFFSDPKKLFRNPIIGLGMLFMKTMEFSVIGIGYLLKK